MRKMEIWKSGDISGEIKNYIKARADLKSLPSLTPEVLRTFPGCENLTDEEAEFKLKCYQSVMPIIKNFKAPRKLSSEDFLIKSSEQVKG